jgi:hypothetical protein
LIQLAALVLLMGIVISTVTTWPASARKRAQSMPLEEVATTWIGVSADQNYVVRLVLHADGTGTGGYVFLDEPPRIFRISSWSYEDARIEILPVAPGGPPSWVSPMRGSILGVTMHLKASGDDWKVELVLRQEEELERRWLPLQGHMAGGPG